MRKLHVILLLIWILVCFVSCPLNKHTKEQDDLIVVSWNVQNLFNAVKDGNEYDEYLPSGGWTQESYNRRLTTFSTAFQYSPLSDSDIIVLNEVENSSVVEDLISQTCLRNKGFLYYATAGETGGAIQIAVLSKLPIVDAKVHSIDGVRPILQVELQSLNERIFVLALHAKSNKEGVKETAPLRLEQAKMVQLISHDILSEDSDALIIVAGDFNESYTDRNMMCDARITTSCPLCLLPSFQNGLWYCPWLDSQNEFSAQGSYYYNGEWRCYDNILISSAGGDQTGYEFDSAGVVFQGVLQTTDNKPNSYRRDLLTGTSDHLPVWIRLIKK